MPIWTESQQHETASALAYDLSLPLCMQYDVGQYGSSIDYRIKTLAVVEHKCAQIEEKISNEAFTSV